MPASSFRVLHIIDTFSMGGVETWLMEVLRHLRQTGSPVQFDILATSGNPGLFDEEARALGANIFYLRYGRSDLGRFIRGFRQILRDRRYDVIHDHQGYASGWHFLMGAGVAPKRRITHFHTRRSGLYHANATARVVARIGRSLTRLGATYITGASARLVQEYRLLARPQTEAAPIYCGFNPMRFAGDRAEERRSIREEFGWPADAKIVLNAGRMDAVANQSDIRNLKNSVFAVRVAVNCAKQDPSLYFLFVGEKSAMLPALEKQVEEAGLSVQIVFTGVRNDIERLMLASDAFFMPSRSEGLGMAAVEAQAAGVPVLVSTGIPRDCIVVPDLVDFKSIDDGEAAWAQTLADIVARPNIRRTRVKEISASRFAIDKSVRNLNSLYGYERPLPQGAGAIVVPIHGTAVA